MEADKEGDDAEDSEAAIDQTPVWRYTADWPSDEREGDYAGAGDYAELEYPFIPDGVNERTYKSDGDDDMGEGEPVSSIGHERVRLVGVDNTVVDAAEPCMERGLAGRCRYRGHMEDAVECGSLAFEREGRDAAED